MKEVKKLIQQDIDIISRMLKDRALLARINDYDDGTRSYFLSGTQSAFGLQPLTINYDGKDYVLHLDRGHEGTVLYKEDKETVINDPNSKIAELTKIIIKRYNGNQHKRAAWLREKQKEQKVTTKVKDKKPKGEVSKLNKFHLATIDLILKDPEYSAVINDYSDGSRAYFLDGPWSKWHSRFGITPLRIDYTNKEYILTMKTEEGKISYKEDEGNVINNPKSEIGKLIEVFIKRYNEKQHKKAAQQRAKQSEIKR